MAQKFCSGTDESSHLRYAEFNMMRGTQFWLPAACISCCDWFFWGYTFKW